MIGSNVLLGGTRYATARTTTAVGGSAVARALLGFVLGTSVAFEATSPDKLVDLGTYLHKGIGSWTGLPVPFTPVELLLLTALFASLVSEASAPPRDRVRPADLSLRLRGGWPVVLFTVFVALGFARGVLGGGDAYIAFWELRYLLYIPICYAIARSSLRTPAHVASLLRIGLVAAIFFAVEGAYRRSALIDTGQIGVIPEFAYEHEDALFLAVFAQLVLVAHVFGAFPKMRFFGLLCVPLMVYTMFATERRAGIIVFLVGLLIIALTTLFVRRRAFFISALPVLSIAVLYLAATWNLSGVLGQPSRAIKSLYEPDPRDASSNLYRLLENVNIDYTIHSDPILGVGFGREFIMAVQLPDLSWWPFWRYETHNNVLWVWMKTGVLGYIVFWTLVGGAMSRAAYAAKRLNDPSLRAAALFALISIVGTVIYAYVDLSLVSGRVTMLLGLALGILAVIERIDRSSPRPALARPAVRRAA